MSTNVDTKPRAQRIDFFLDLSIFILCVIQF